ncbi:HAMP domain-containing protein [Geobacter pelophilus]|uniref:histidine kinase n=1 Tax=Geoanaerobacter pelophilus TaxID=60036 RepID=A0AAW4L3E4_9BACT|nr:PAS domain-containing sensor histidine kinase [Geoanaerobacter pelophilus]MBT0665674.1 HAMP domain-containing protein [Geoanaerobacter pelophilus]
MRPLSLFKKLLIALFLLSLLPLGLSSGILFLKLKDTGSSLSEQISTAVDRQASENLEMRARQIAADISDFLIECEADVRLAAALSGSPQGLRAFYDNRQGVVWYRTGTRANPREVREEIPRYRSIELIADDGRQQLVIKEGKLLPQAQLADVSDPAQTEFRSETYFRDSAQLKPGEIHVSHLTGFHVSKEEQLAGAKEPEEAVGGKEYRGVIRFCAPLFAADGRRTGLIVLSLDHRHLMEFTQHVLPGKVGETVFPSYRSGNYAFMFDDEGWMITHPKFWDIRGVDRNGILVPPYSATSSKADIETGRIPYNLDHAGFIHPNYPVVASLARQQKSGFVDVTNVGGARKVMAFAPIPYRSGVYQKSGIFGGVTIGFQTDLFHEPARTAMGIIANRLREHLTESAFILITTCLFAVAAAWLISRGVTHPLSLLTTQARSIAEGNSSKRVEVKTRDELGELAEDFNRMADELESRNSSLMDTLSQLQHSRTEIIEERDFKESILESISSGILAFSPSGILISINRNGSKMIGMNDGPGAHFQDIFRTMPAISARIEQTLHSKSGYGRLPVTIDTNGSTRHLDVGIFPIGPEASRGLTVTMRDETEKERMREEMTRMDRLASLGKISAGIAHEIRNPLTGITLLLDDLHDRPGLDPNTQLMIGHALTETERVERLISSLLSYSSPPRASFVRSDLNAAVQEGLVLFRKACEKQGVELTASCQPIPLFPFDADQVRQLLLNLLGNALEAVAPGGRITIGTFCTADCAGITVADTGPGIPEEDIPRLFEPFFTRKSAGTGLGLSIVQRIVEEHHGNIRIESKVGQGTVFTVELAMGWPDC